MTLETKNYKNKMLRKEIFESLISPSKQQVFISAISKSSIFSRRMQLRRSCDRRVGSTDSEHDPDAILSHGRDCRSEISVRSQRPLLYTASHRV